MSDSIRVSLTPDSLKTMPAGDAVEAVVTIQNVGTSVDQYAVELDGLPTTWYNLSNESVALFPQDKEEAKIVIKPPKGNGVKAGSYPFTVTVLSRADATETSRVEGTLEIGAIAAFDLDMSPKKVIGRKGNYNITMRNGGNADLDVELEAIDAEEACRYTFNPPSPHLTAGQKVVTRLTVKPRRSSCVGQKRNYDFQIKVKPSQGDVKQLQAQLMHTPRFRTWKPIRRLVYLIILVAVIAAVVSTFSGAAGANTQAMQLRDSAARLACTRFHVFCGIAGTGSSAGSAMGSAEHGGYRGEFLGFHQTRPKLIGQPLENEHKDSQGFTVQRTTNGLLVFDPLDVRAFFVTRGEEMWVHDNNGTYSFKG
jgi:hypothetical protein